MVRAIFEDDSDDTVVAPPKKTVKKSAKKSAKRSSSRSPSRSPKSSGRSLRTKCADEVVACHTSGALSKADIVKLIGGVSPKKAKKPAKSPSKAKKAKKDPNAPKGSKNAYMFFVADKRESIVKTMDLSGLDNKEKIGAIGKEMGKQWNAIKGTAKAQKYDAQAVADKARHLKEMLKYDPSYKPAKKVAKKAKSPLKGEARAKAVKAYEKKHGAEGLKEFEGFLKTIAPKAPAKGARKAKK